MRIIGCDKGIVLFFIILKKWFLSFFTSENFPAEAEEGRFW